jgi:hypothetical protein
MKTSKEPDYSFLVGLEPIYVLNKKHAKDYMEYYIDKDEKWFFYVVTRVRKTKEIKHCSMIIRKDVQDWLGYAERQGWETVKMYEENEEHESN